MYVVVGCQKCRALWVVEGRPETTQCPRCGTRRQFSKLKRFARTEDSAEAKQARSALLARRQDRGEAFAELDPFADLEERAMEMGLDDEAFLEASGVDSEAVTAAGERAEPGADSGGPDRLEVVRSALAELDESTVDDVVAYAADRGVEESFVREALERLVQHGEATKNRGVYRLI